MDEVYKNIFISARPKQWIKNLSIFVGITFSGWLFIPDKFLLALLAFVNFCLLSSTIYIFNDILDLSSDRLHPVKRKRPIASGKLPYPIALFIVVCGFFASLFLAMQISFFFFLICLLYSLMHFAYSLYLKKISIIDVFIIAAGFIFRVWAGAVAVDAHISVWLLLCITSFSLFLAVGKRRCEANLLEGVAAKHRESLLFYPKNLLDIYIIMFATSTWLTYALFTFSHPTAIELGKTLSIMANLPRTLVAQKWLMLTVPLVIYGVMRYLQLIYGSKKKIGLPEEVFLSDKTLIAIVALWSILVVVTIYL